MANTYAVVDFHRDYPDSAACLDKLMDLRVGFRSTCRRCDRPTRFHRLRRRRAYTRRFRGVQVWPPAGCPRAPCL